MLLLFMGAFCSRGAVKAASSFCSPMGIVYVVDTMVDSDEGGGVVDSL